MGIIAARMRWLVRTARAWVPMLVSALTLSSLALALSPLAGLASAEFRVQAPALEAGGGEIGEGQFGASVALSGDGNTAVIGAPADNGGAGAAWVFTRSGETWTRGQELTGGGELGAARFGSSVAISSDGGTLIVGGPVDNGGAGAAWVFTRSGETWTQQGEKLTGSGEVGEGHLGASVAVFADARAAVGGPGDNAGAGAVWMFVHSSAWAQQGEKLTGGGEVGTGNFGTSVAMTENNELVGGPADNGNFGAVWPFKRTTPGWVSEGEKLTGSEGAWRLGASVALSEKASTAVVGGPAAGFGVAWIFLHGTGGWLKTSVRIKAHYASEGSNFGAGVSLAGNGTTALVGGPGNGELEQGAAWVFKGEAGTWRQEGSELASEVGEEFGEFGAAVALSANGTTALVGAPGEASFRGAAWAYLAHEPKLEAPEIGRCKKVAAGFGSYGNSSCTAAIGGGKHEWFPELVKTGFTTKLATGTVKLETVGLSKVVCLGETGSGELVGLKSASRVELVLTGCERSGSKCSSAGAAEGEIVTSLLNGQLGLISLGETPTKNVDGLELFAAKSGEAVTAFACGPTHVSIRGAVIVPLPYSKMARLLKVKPTALKGKQRPEQFEGGPKDVLEASFDEGAYEQIGLSAALTFEFEEPAEINSVF